MFKNFIISFLLVVSICVSIACGVFHYRLEQTRHELESIRVEYERAQDQQRELREIVRGTDEVLNKSFNTLSGIRSQIEVIRASYQKMENMLYGSGDGNSDDNNDTNYSGEE